MSIQFLIFSIIFLPLLIVFVYINIKHNTVSGNKKFEIIASPVYYILILVSMVWFSYILIIGLDPHF